MKMKKTVSIVCLLLLLMFLPVSVFAWGSATHTYLTKELGNRFVIMNQQEMYGAVSPDMFNLMFGYPHQQYLWIQTHYEFMKVVDKAKFGRKKAFAYGLASHNEAWGADHTAHIDAITIECPPGIICPPGKEGYVVIKSKILALLLEDKISAFLAPIYYPNTPPTELVKELSLKFADTGVESAVDYLVSQNEDKQVGIQMLLSAKYRSLFVPLLLCKAYAKDFAEEAGISLWEAYALIIKTEKEFKKYMELYGGILTQENAMDLMAEQGALLAENILEKEYGITVNVPTELMKGCLIAAIGVVQSDYSAELAATLEYVNEQLEIHGIETCSPWFALWKEGASEIEDTAQPLEFSLEQNYPNPFNPTTTINYSLAEDSHVKVVVYNALGQEVAVLVDSDEPKGYQSVIWDASGLASGVYFYRIETEVFTETKRMFLLK